MTNHLICIGIIFAAYWVAKNVVCKVDYSTECDNAVKEAQSIINQKFISNESK